MRQIKTMSRKDKPRRAETHRQRRARARAELAAHGDYMAEHYRQNPPADGCSLATYWTRKPKMMHGYRRCTWRIVKARRRQAAAAKAARLLLRRQLYPYVTIIPRRFFALAGSEPEPIRWNMVGELQLRRDAQNPDGYYADSSDPM